MLVTRLKLPPFIVTLATLASSSRSTRAVAAAQTIRGSDMPAIMTWTGTAIPVGGFRLTYGVVIMFLMYRRDGLGAVQTAWGAHFYAVGDDPEAARLAGVRTTGYCCRVYISPARIIAIGAWLQIGRPASASPNAGADLNLDSITAVVIGGTSLFGGRGMVWAPWSAP